MTHQRRWSLLAACAAVICVLATSGTAAQDRTAARVSGWRSDADVFVRELGRQHYLLRNGPLPDSIREMSEQFKRNVAGWSDERALAELMRIAAMAGDGHTYVLPFGAARVSTRMLPIRLYQFSDGLYVIDAAAGWEPLIGTEVRSISGVSAIDVMHRIRPYVARDNDAGIVWAGPVLLRFAGYLEAVANRRITDTVSVQIRTRGRDTMVVLMPVPVPPMRGVPKLIASRMKGAPPVPLYLRNVGTNFWMQALDDSVLYVQFNQVMNGPTETLRQFAERLDSALVRSRPRELIIDVRHNNGGNAELLHPLIAVLRRFTSASGKLVVISGRNTFSAAQIFLARAEHEARATIAGEPSSSKPNFVGEENAVILPWSGAYTSISNRYHETIRGDRRQWIEPRPRIELRSADYFANRDPVLERLLRR